MDNEKQKYLQLGQNVTSDLRVLDGILEHWAQTQLNLKAKETAQLSYQDGKQAIQNCIQSGEESMVHFNTDFSRAHCA